MGQNNFTMKSYKKIHINFSQSILETKLIILSKEFHRLKK